MRLCLLLSVSARWVCPAGAGSVRMPLQSLAQSRHVKAAEGCPLSG
jgi:hypothetical protein